LRKFVSTLIVAFVVAAFGAGVAAAAGVQKVDLLGPHGNVFCNGSGVLAGAADGFGFAVMNAPANGTVAATVSLKGLQPDTEYSVFLIQGNSDCGTPDGTIMTNRQGNGTTYVSEPSVSDHAVVGVMTAGMATVFVTSTYWH
jgi:hypothetical protein